MFFAALGAQSYVFLFRFMAALQTFSTNPMNMKKHQITALAASTLAIFLIFIMSYCAPSAYSGDISALFGEYFRPSLQMEGELHLFVSRSDSPPISDSLADLRKPTQALEEGINAYNRRNFRRAIIDFNFFISAMPDHRHCTEARLYLAISHLANGEDSEAKKILKDWVQNRSKHDLTTNAQWYLALALLKERNVQEARPLLKAVAATNKSTSFQNKAAELLNKLP